MDLTLGLTVLASYLLGAVPFGLVITRLAGLGDIREIGSGNIGATNVYRTGRKDLALATLLLDAGKGAIAVLVAAAIFKSPMLSAAAGMAAFIGHCFPIYLKFKGGKGVATFFGTLFAISWPVGLGTGAVWLITLALFRMSSLSGLMAAAVSPFLGWHFMEGNTWLCIAAISIVVFVRHHENIKRIAAGTESKIGKSKD
jgi:glycerol-3-phosphate acyltransferase PlsY